MELLHKLCLEDENPSDVRGGKAAAAAALTTSPLSQLLEEELRHSSSDAPGGGKNRKKLAATARIVFAHVADSVWRIDTQLIYLLEDIWGVLKDWLRAEAGLNLLGREEREAMNRVGLRRQNFLKMWGDFIRVSDSYPGVAEQRRGGGRKGEEGRDSFTIKSSNRTAVPGVAEQQDVFVFVVSTAIREWRNNGGEEGRSRDEEGRRGSRGRRFVRNKVLQSDHSSGSGGTTWWSTGVGEGNAEGAAGVTTSAGANAAGATNKIHMRCEEALRVRNLRIAVQEQQSKQLRGKHAQLQVRYAEMFSHTRIAYAKKADTLKNSPARVQWGQMVVTDEEWDILSGELNFLHKKRDLLRMLCDVANELRTVRKDFWEREELLHEQVGGVRWGVGQDPPVSFCSSLKTCP